MTRNIQTMYSCFIWRRKSLGGITTVFVQHPVILEYMMYIMRDECLPLTEHQSFDVYRHHSALLILPLCFFGECVKSSQQRCVCVCVCFCCLGVRTALAPARCDRVSCPARRTVSWPLSATGRRVLLLVTQVEWEKDQVILPHKITHKEPWLFIQVFYFS